MRIKELDDLKAYPVIYSGDHIIDFIILAPQGVKEELEEIVKDRDRRWSEMSDDERLETGYDNGLDYILDEVVQAGYYVIDKGPSIYY